MIRKLGLLVGRLGLLLGFGLGLGFVFKRFK